VDEAVGDGWRSEDDRRLGEEAGWEWARRRRERLARLRPGQLERVELAREEFLAGRRDRRRVETLLDGASAAARAEEGRREQRRLDEWFLSRSADRGQRSRES
jgi:flagellar biosynthesis chaperone FliJ